jgi:hypothetical protein
VPQGSNRQLKTLIFVLVILFACGSIIYFIRPKPTDCTPSRYRPMELEDETHFPLPPLEPIRTDNIRQIQRLGILRTHLPSPVDIEFSPNSQMLVMTSGSDPYLVVKNTYWWMLNTNNLCVQGYGGYGSYEFRGFSPDSSLMLIQTNQGLNTVRLLDIEYRHFFAEYYRAAFVVADGEVRLRYQANQDSPVELHPIRWSIPEDVNYLRAVLDTPKIPRIIIGRDGNTIDKSNPLLFSLAHLRTKSKVKRCSHQPRCSPGRFFHMVSRRNRRQGKN